MEEGTLKQLLKAQREDHLEDRLEDHLEDRLEECEQYKGEHLSKKLIQDLKKHHVILPLKMVTPFFNRRTEMQKPLFL